MSEFGEMSENDKCFLCGKIIEMEIDEVSFLFEKLNDGNEHDSSSFADTLTSIITTKLDEDDLHSKFICAFCAQMVCDYKDTELKCLQLKNKITECYKKTNEEQSNTPEKEDNASICIVFEQSNSQSEVDEIIQKENEDIVIEESTSINKSDEVVSEEQFLSIFESEMEDVLAEYGIMKEVIIKEDIIKADLEDDLNNGKNQTLEITSDNSSHYEQIIEEMENSDEEIANDLTIEHGNMTDNEIGVEELPSNKSSSIKSNIKRKQPKTKKQQNVLPYKFPPYFIHREKMICCLCNSNPELPQVEFEFSAMSMHLKTEHNIRAYICDMCGEEFARRRKLHEHIDEKHTLEEGEFECKDCKRIFTNLQVFTVHKKMHFSASTKQHVCSECNKKFSSKNLLEEHMNKHTGKKPFKCNCCTKSFTSKYTLSAHLKIHEDRPRPFTCDKCPKTFFNNQNLLQHKMTHSGLRNFICEVCSKAFGTQHNLDVHKIVHTGKKPFFCRFCNKAFARRAEIRDHERTHTGEKPFSCNICNASFAQRSNLTTHKRATHLNDKRHKCEKCDRSFKRRRLLDYHIRAVHTKERPHKCDICGSSFVYPEHFKKHQRIHSGEKPYACEFCGKKFNSRDNRNAHRFVHSQKKPYECLACGLGFMRKPLLYSHMQQAGHLNDTIVVNQPKIYGEKMESDENLSQDLEMVEEHLVVDGSEQIISEIKVPAQLLAVEPNNILIDNNEEIIGLDEKNVQIIQITSDLDDLQKAYSFVKLDDLHNGKS